MEKIKKLIKNGDDFQKLLDLLINRVKNNEGISNNPMLDGFIISFMISKDKITRDFFLDEYTGMLLDSTLQQLEQIAIWVSINENALCDIYNNV